ncbi:MAG: hypothetical protein ACR2N7_03185 [Acidimicrobiia bacterium]
MNANEVTTPLASAKRPTWVRATIWVAVVFLLGSIILGMMLY